MEPKDDDDLAANAAEEESKSDDAANAADEKSMDDDAETSTEGKSNAADGNDNGDDILKDPQRFSIHCPSMIL